MDVDGLMFQVENTVTQHNTTQPYGTERNRIEQNVRAEPINNATCGRCIIIGGRVSVIGTICGDPRLVSS